MKYTNGIPLQEIPNGMDDLAANPRPVEETPMDLRVRRRKLF